MSEALFWSAALLVLYTYILFPMLLALRGIIRPRPWREPRASRGTEIAPATPSVSLLVAAHNEAGVIEKKLENLLSLDYPQECLEVIVASDGSDDGTNERVERYAAAHAARDVRLLALPRRGKAHALNAAAEAARGEILVFSDANSIYAQDALRELVRPFADPQVGGVAGNQRYLSADDEGLAGRGEQQYWSLDRTLKQLESDAGNVISATGAIYAVRGSLFRSIPDGVTDDFYNSTGVIERGYRLVFAPQAVAYETVSGSGQDQFRRKVRIITRGLHAVYMRRRLLNPLAYGFYALQLFSHKVLRRLVIFPLLALLALSVRLRRRHPLYRLAALGQIAFYGLAAIGAVLQRGRGLAQWTRRAPSRLFSLPYYFCMVNLAALVAVLNTLRGRRIVLWEPEERE